MGKTLYYSSGQIQADNDDDNDKNYKNDNDENDDGEDDVTHIVTLLVCHGNDGHADVDSHTVRQEHGEEQQRCLEVSDSKT